MYICVHVYVLMIKDSNWKLKVEQNVHVREWKREKEDAINKPRNKTKTKWTQNRKKKDREKADLKKSVLSGTQNPRAKNIRASALAQRVRQCITLE